MNIQQTKMTTGRLLLSWIKKYSGTVAEFSKDIGIPETTIRHWVSDRCSIRPIKLAVLAEYFAEEMNENPMDIYLQLVLSDKHIKQVIINWQNLQGNP